MNVDGAFRELCRRAEELATTLTIPGVALGVIHKDVIHTAALGITSIEHGLPITDTTLFQIGSISKTFLGTAAMRLVEQGRLFLDAPVRAILPELRLRDQTAQEQTTLRHLLTHTGGWTGDYFDDTGWGDDALARYVARMAELPQELPLGRLFSYNNAGFNLAGRMIERVTGSPFEQAMAELVFKPLNLQECFYFPDDAMTHRFSVGHIVDQGVATVARPWSIGRSAHPAGGIVASLRDLLRYAAFHLGSGVTPSGERLLSSEGLATMARPQAPTGAMPDQIGLSWFLHEVEGRMILSHGGATNGQMARLVVVPAAGFALACLTNASTGSTLHDEIARLALQLFLGIAEPEPMPISLPAEQLAAYAGRYTNPLYDYEVTVAGETLEIRLISRGGFPHRDSPPRPVPPPMPAVFYAEDKIMVTDGLSKGLRGDFGRNEAGAISWLRMASRVRMRI